MEHEINDIDDLIGKVLAGEASPEEQLRLEVWSHANADNRKYFDQVKTIFQQAASHQIQLHFDADAAWNKVKRQLHQSEEKKSYWFEITRTGPLLRIAASIVFLMVFGIYGYLQLFKPTDQFAVTSDKTTVQDTLPDGSTAFLNKQSSIQYEYNRRQKTRKVKLKGEGFFEVKHVEEKPFVIEADEVLVRDVGTAFNVKAYPESDTIEVTVKSGEVQIYTQKNAGLDLKAGETGIYSKRLREFSRLMKADTNVLSYKTGVLSFNNSDLKSVIDKINEIYDAKIILENPALASCRLTVSFHGDSLDTIVDVIAETLKLTVTREKKKILLNGPGCN